ncbi:uncharacterized protein [Paramisgurnus dabryanus]|uniref:uncharacterized protein n=1 Tax=Paramisgurnus dabryanus TaxID=90735 RepID=UPI003CCF3267
MWTCKDCDASFQRRSVLLKHYRLDHKHHGRGHLYPCTYVNCPCRFKTWNALISHLSRGHPSKQQHQAVATVIYTCHVCGCNQLSSDKEYFQHISVHLKNYETINCMFLGCSYETNIYNNFKTHKYRKHRHFRLEDFKPGVVEQRPISGLPLESANTSEFEESTSKECTSPGFANEDQDQLNDIEVNLASLLLKLENIYLVSSSAINDLLCELRYLIGSLSVPATLRIVSQVFQHHSYQIEESVLQELASTLCKSNPIHCAIADNGPLSTSWRRKAYYRSHFNVVEPTEYVLDPKKNKTFQYVPLLKSLQQVLNCQPILDKVINFTEGTSEPHTETPVYKSYRDGLHFKENPLLSEASVISLILYVDDFEICNPLGTSKKKHKVCGVYWVLGSLPSYCQSSLSSIYLAALIKSEDVKSYGYEKVLQPLINDLVNLEQHGVFISKLGRVLKGTVQFVVADNLAAHGIGGFVESFSGTHVCRFCTAEKSEIQSQEVRSVRFPMRNKHGRS